MAVPLVRSLRHNLPKALITWVISRPAYDLVEGMEGIEFIVIEKPSSLRDYWHFKKRLKDRSFDVLLALQASFRANLLYPCIRADRKIGYDTLRAKDGHKWFINESIMPGNDHTLEGFLKFLYAVGYPKIDLRWDLPISIEDDTWAEAQIANVARPVLLINPAASKPERNWLVERYIEVIEEVQTRWGVQVILIGGPGTQDKVLAESIMQGTPKCLSLVGQTKPKQLLALIRKADALMCPDTGPSHMAAAVSTPVVALHAVTSSQVSGPYIYQHLAVDCYPQAAKKVFEKSSQDIPWGTHVHGLEAMQLISVKSVLEKLALIFAKTNP